MNPGHDAITALLDASKPKIDIMVDDAICKGIGMIRVTDSIVTNVSITEVYITSDDEQHDRTALRRWILGTVGRCPTMRTAIGQEAVDLIMTAITADLQALESIK